MSAIRVVLTLTLLATSSAAAQTPRQQIEAQEAKFTAAVNAKDGTAAGAFYATDAMLLVPNAATIKGREGIGAFWGGMAKDGLKIDKLTTTEVVKHGDMADEVGEYSLQVTPVTGPVMHDHGKYIVIWKHDRKHGWQLYRDIWNSSVPAAK
jgi:ketosteroid isomerase-like protein